MFRFSPRVVPEPPRRLDFSPLGNALDRMNARREQREQRRLAQEDRALRIRQAGGRPVAEAEELRRGDTLDRLLDTPLPEVSQIGERGGAYSGPSSTPRAHIRANAYLGGGASAPASYDPYAEPTGVGGVELGGARGGASARMVTTSGRSLSEYLQPYRLTLGGTEYEFDPLHAARTKAAEQGFEEDAEIQRMRGLGMSPQQIARSKYPDRSLTFPERRELKELDAASRAEVQRQRAIVTAAQLRLEERRIAMLEAARKNSADYANQRMLYLREKKATDDAIAMARLRMDEYQITAGTLGRQDPDLMDDEALREAEALIAATRRRAQGATDRAGRVVSPTPPPAAPPVPAPAPSDTTRRRAPANPYRPQR